MYDAIDVAIPRKMLCGDKPVLKDYLVVLKARLPTMKITYGPRNDAIFIHCSLPRLLYGNNIKTMIWEDVPTALGKLESLIGIDLHHGVVRRVEIGATFAMEAPPTSYLVLWHTCARTEKDIYDSQSTVLFRNRTWSFYGYDKVAETRKMGFDTALYPKNLLRLEYRHMRSLKGLLGRLVTPWDLVDPLIYSALVERWLEVFRSIVQGGMAQFQSIPKSPKELAANLSAIGLSTVGFDTAHSMIEAGRKTGDITKSNASRMRMMISSISKQPGVVHSQELIEEIKGKAEKLAVPEIARRPKCLCENQDHDLTCCASK